MAEKQIAGRFIAQTPHDYSFCAGCMSCELVCALTHDGVTSPSRRRLRVRRDIRTMTHEALTCRHCADHPCYEACPKKGMAMVLGDDGVVSVNEEECIGCGLCAKACVFEPSRINIDMTRPVKERKARKCDMCRDREGGPACVEWCPVRCLYVSLN